MSTTDINPAAPSEERRYTAHLFSPDVPHNLEDPRVSSGSPLRVPDTTDQWPPDILFDIVYAGAILHHFSTRALKDELSKSWKDAFYPGGVTTASQADHKAIIDQRAAAKARTETQAQEPKVRYETRRGPDLFAMFMIFAKWHKECMSFAFYSFLRFYCRVHDFANFAKWHKESISFAFYSFLRFYCLFHMMISIRLDCTCEAGCTSLSLVPRCHLSLFIPVQQATSQHTHDDSHRYTSQGACERHHTLKPLNLNTSHQVSRFVSL